MNEYSERDKLEIQVGASLVEFRDYETVVFYHSIQNES